MGRRGSPLALAAHIEEDHHDVLWPLLSAIGAKRLPFTGHILVHLDSHPDLLLPRSLTAEACRDKRQLLQQVSIENWILPCAFLGVINRIVWVRPPWSDQIPSGRYQFHVGREQATGNLRLTALESYFLSEALTVPLADLTEPQLVDLLVVELNGREEHRIMDFVGPPDEYSLLLDVDLDFFSTTNPFLGLYERAQLYPRLRQLYHFDSVPSLATGYERLRLGLESSQRRDRLLDRLEDVFKHLQVHRSLSGYIGPGEVYLDVVSELFQSLTDHYSDEDIDWDLVHCAGCTCDDSELPHHISTDLEIDGLLEHVENLLGRLPRPNMVTVARSSRDEFCPPHQVESIQSKLVSLLERLYADIDVRFDYKDDEST
ncbi:hypothetical protein TCAL_12613 [Tigriopus californicus]|uniref:Uncharacterized protein n=2 Tax=Tigriopus californicus TaxID=6832 RepID=A0A553P1D6_TIGCA|nr:hypothetical protein TCAL_12613 [Tigriopus californicus]|eukprot:TCALIF_12613-PA protein Name:"Similar to zgc:56556 UPF0489 protein C5orf22 homolog (Danio rerio)" AED:0.00 eAED:0.01 QI:0/-1/0/1/-1/1/1/0/372